MRATRIGDLGQALQNFQDLEPGFRDALSNCNNESGIAETMQEFQDEQENLSPEEIEARNRGLKAFAECAKKLGYDMGELRPNSDGLLQPTNITGGGGLDGIDEIIQECGGEAAAAAEEE